MNIHSIKTFVINTIVFLLTVSISLTVGTIAITRKVNTQNAAKSYYEHAVVLKEKIAVVSQSRGVLTAIGTQVGEPVKKGDVLAEIDNPSLREKADILKSYEDNESAQTEATVIENDLANLTVYAPVDGVTGEIHVKEFDPVESLTKIATLYSHTNVSILANLTDNAFQTIVRSNDIKIYSPRLNQSFPVTIDRIRPYQEIDSSGSGNTLGVYMKLDSPEYGKDLLHNETVIILPWESAPKQQKPADFFTDFWNGLLSLPEKKTS